MGSEDDHVVDRRAWSHVDGSEALTDVQTHDHTQLRAHIKKWAPIFKVVIRRQTLNMRKFRHCYCTTTLGSNTTNFSDHRFLVPHRDDCKRDEPTRVCSAPLVNVPVVVCTQHDKGEILILGLLEIATTESCKRRKAHRLKNSVAVHVPHTLVNVICARTHLGKTGWVKAPLFFGPGDNSIESHCAHRLTLEGPHVMAPLVLLILWCLILVLCRNMSIKHVWWLDNVVVDADENQVLNLHFSP